MFLRASDYPAIFRWEEVFNIRFIFDFVLDMMGLYLGGELKVEIKSNWQIFPVDARSIDYVGFKQNHYGILLRSGILKRFYKKFHRTIM